MTKKIGWITVMLLAGISGCAKPGLTTFEQDVRFLNKHTDAVVLSAPGGQAQIVVVPAYQGRVMTSTLAGEKAMSFGWVNRSLIASGKTHPNFNAFGGEERLWLAPEGGQFSIFFAEGAAFDVEHWQVPAVLDTEPFDVVARTAESVRLRKRTTLENYSGTCFEIEIDRKVRVLNTDESAGILGFDIPRSVKLVGFETDNRLINRGQTVWSKQTGLLAIWILGQFNPSVKTTVVIPFEPGPETELGYKVRDSYFGKIPDDRLVVRDDVLFFLADGKSRGKIGLSQRRATPFLGSYDGVNKVLTVVHYNRPAEPADYVNNLWGIQDNPYDGAAVMSYNDGPLGPGLGQLGPFYELETASPAKRLKPGQSVRHLHQTFHFQGSPQGLDTIAQATLGVSIQQITEAMSR